MSGSPLAAGAPGRQPLVLVVEDDPDCRAIFRTILLASGFSVLEAENGREGVRLAMRYAPDVVLMDLDVPVVDGWSATRKLRERRETATIPVVAVSGHVLPEHEARAWEAGCAAFLAKPVSPLEVVAEVRRILNALAPPSPRLHIQD